MSFIWLLMKIIFWINVFAALLTTVIPHILLWIELRLTAFQEAKTLPISLPTFFKSMGIEFLCTFGKVSLLPFYSLSPVRHVTYEKGKALPTLLIHGYFDNQMDWVWFARQLQQKEGIGPLFALNLSPPNGAITEFAQQVKAKVDEIRTQTGADKVILVGHSMGGLVCSYYCENLAEPGSIKRVITLGTCFKGTATTALGIGRSMVEMAPESAFLETLQHKIQKSKVPYFSVVGKMDQFIIPWDSGLLEDMPENKRLILEDHGHLRLLISRAVIEQVSKWILLA